MVVDQGADLAAGCAGHEHVADAQRAALDENGRKRTAALVELRLDHHLEPLEQMLDSGNGAQRQWRRHDAGDDIHQIYAEIVAQTCETYAEAPAGVGACGGVPLE